MLTARQAAAELGVSERTIRRWISSGQLHAEKNGGGFIIDPQAAREVFNRSRAGRSAHAVSAYAELHGRYLEVCDRLQRAEERWQHEKARGDRLERILYMPENDGAGS